MSAQDWQGSAIIYFSCLVISMVWFGIRWDMNEIDLSEAFASVVFWPVCVLACLIKGAWRRASRGFQ